MQELMAEGLSNGALHGSAVQNLLLETLSIVLRLSVSISAVDTRLQFGAAALRNGAVSRDMRNAVPCSVINMAYLESCLLLWCSLVQSVFFHGRENGVSRVSSIEASHSSNFYFVDYSAVNIGRQQQRRKCFQTVD